MALKLIQTGNSLPLSFPLNPTSTFEAGMVAELSLLGNDVVCGISSGLTPLGLVDDTKTKAFIQPQIDEEVLITPDLVGTPGTGPSGQPIITHDILIELQNPSIVKGSFVADYPVFINNRNGTIRVKAGSNLNYASIPNGSLDSIRIIVSYAFQVPDMPGDDTTVGSGRITVWVSRIVASTDVYDTTQSYPLNAPLFCGLDGRLTTKQPTPNHPGIAIVIGPPSATVPMLDFLFL